MATETQKQEKATPQGEETTAGGHMLPANWLARIALIWSGYAVSAFTGNAASYSAFSL